MFTGIVETTVPVHSLKNNRLIISRPQVFTPLNIGQSIAVNGACLSVMKYNQSSIEFDVVPETLSRTNLSTSKRVNVERALPANGRFEGHIVTGHVDTLARLLTKTSESLGMRYTFELPAQIADFVVQKGSVTLNGVSLTLAAITEDTFDIALIPHTLQETNLGALGAGELVNVETDMMAKYWRKWHRNS